MRGSATQWNVYGLWSQPGPDSIKTPSKLLSPWDSLSLTVNEYINKQTAKTNQPYRVHELHKGVKQGKYMAKNSVNASTWSNIYIGYSVANLLLLDRLSLGTNTLFTYKTSRGRGLLNVFVISTALHKLLLKNILNL